MRYDGGVKWLKANLTTIYVVVAFLVLLVVLPLLGFGFPNLGPGIP